MRNTTTTIDSSTIRNDSYHKDTASLSRNSNFTNADFSPDSPLDRSNDGEEHRQESTSNLAELEPAEESAQDITLEPEPEQKSAEKSEEESTRKHEKLEEHEREPQPGIRICDVVHRIKEILFRDFILTEVTYTQSHKNQSSYNFCNIDNCDNGFEYSANRTKIRDDFTRLQYESRDIIGRVLHSRTDDTENNAKQMERKQFSITGKSYDTNATPAIVTCGDH